MAFSCTFCQSHYLSRKYRLAVWKAYRSSLVLLAYVSTCWETCDITIPLPKALAVLLRWYCITLCRGMTLNNKSNIILVVFSWMSDCSTGHSLTCSSGACLPAQAAFLHWFKPDCVCLQFSEELTQNSIPVPYFFSCTSRPLWEML